MGIDANTLMVIKTTGRKIVGRGTGLQLRPPHRSTLETRPTPRMRRNQAIILLRRLEAQMREEIAHVQTRYPIEPYECFLKTFEIETAELTEIT